MLDWLVLSWGLHPEHAKLPATLSFSDLPRVAHDQSARGVRKRFDAGDHTKPLWRQLTKAFICPLTLQWLLEILDAASQFGTRFAMHRLLQHLESASARDTMTWVWVAMVAACQLGETVGDNWGGWVGHSKLQLPLLSLVQSLILEKMMRLKAQDESSGTDDKKQSAESDPIKLLGDDR